MADWSKNRIDSSSINNGREFTADDNLSIAELNAMVNNSFYAVDFAEAMADAPDISEIGGSGTPSVSFVDNGKFKRFKFSNLRGEQGARGEVGARGRGMFLTDAYISNDPSEQEIYLSEVEYGNYIVEVDDLVMSSRNGNVGIVTQVNYVSTGRATVKLIYRCSLMGVAGEQGQPNTLTIGSVTSGTTASATITGTSPNQVLNLVLPKGEKGDKGDKGDSIVLDTELSEISANAVENRVITTEINRLKTAIESAGGGGLNKTEYNFDSVQIFPYTSSNLESNTDTIGVTSKTNYPYAKLVRTNTSLPNITEIVEKLKNPSAIGYVVINFSEGVNRRYLIHCNSLYALNVIGHPIDEPNYLFKLSIDSSAIITKAYSPDKYPTNFTNMKLIKIIIIE